MRTIDDSQRPLLYVTLPAHVTPAWLGEHKDDCVAVIARDEPYGYVYDLRAVQKGTDAGNRKKAGELIDATRDGTERLAKAVAFVSSNSVIRGVLKAVFWVQSMSAPHQVFSTLPEAEAWVRKTLAEAGVAVPSGERAAS